MNGYLPGQLRHLTLQATIKVDIEEMRKINMSFRDTIKRADAE